MYSGSSFIRESQNSHEGYLLVKSEWSDGWEARYIKLQKPFIMIFNDATDAVANNPDRIIILSPHMSVSNTVCPNTFPPSLSLSLLAKITNNP